jgi:N-acetyl-beta-hexosaminidase
LNWLYLAELKNELRIMNKIAFHLILVFISSFIIIHETLGSSDVSIIPKPVSLKLTQGEFHLKEDVRIYIVTPSEEMTRVGLIFSKEIKSLTGLGISLSPTKLPKKVILLELTGDTSVHQESYYLTISPIQVLIKAPSVQGLFYGLQSLKQLILTSKSENGVIILPALEIFDYPRFAWRGMHLDVSRHFFTADSIKRYIDFLATYKFNRFHWHLSDHEGWRVEIKKYPRLTEIGAFMRETASSRMNDKSKETPDWFPKGGFYTQEEIKDLVQYAADRFIVVIPEIDIPGHCYALIASYPELGVSINKDSVTKKMEPPLILNPSEKTFGFLENLFSELMILFPSEYIHMGGDESRLDQWKASPAVQKQIEMLGLKNEEELHGYFIKRMEKIIRDKGRRMIGWDDINDGGALAKNSVVMAWRGEGGYENAIKAAKLGNEVVMSPETHCYLNFYQADPKTEPKAYDGFLPLEKIYLYEPVPAELDKDKTKYILGAQACVWAEYLTNFRQVEYQIFPRITALSEVDWSQPERKDFQNYKIRLKNQVQLFKAYHINYAKLPEYEKYTNTDSLPCVFQKNQADLINSRLRNEALVKFASQQLPDNLMEWKRYRTELLYKIIAKTGLKINHDLPLNIKETANIKMEGYSIKNIAFQTQPGIYATANLYVPDGIGPFPALIILHGHSNVGKIDYQVVGHSFAQNGYVCLAIDAWGSGERSTTFQGEYHGGNLGASLLNIGESLMGMQITDNIRGVDLLLSLSYVDKNNIGATGASGGGNMTMWLAAIDDRIKAAMPFISVGTFESYIMRSNCICELLTEGLTFTEEAGVIALIAPRALKICNHQKDDNPTFYPSEMLRSFNNAKSIFDLFGVENNIGYQIFDFTHGYFPADQAAAINWFNLHLKRIVSMISADDIKFISIPKEKLLVFPDGKRDPKVLSTEEYCRQRGQELRNLFLNSNIFDADQKKMELRNILRVNEKSYLKNSYRYSSLGGWDRMALETSDGKLIPILHKAPAKKSQTYIIISNPLGKSEIQAEVLRESVNKGIGIVIVDLSGTGEAISSTSILNDGNGKLHTLARAELWLGRTIIGEWVQELDVVTQFLESSFKVTGVSIDGSREAGLAALFFADLKGEKVDNLVLRDVPVSYLFDTPEGLDFFSLGIHIPGFLEWGDVSLAAALSGKNINFINPVTMSGQKVKQSTLKEIQSEFEKLRSNCNQPGRTIFN